MRDRMTDTTPAEAVWAVWSTMPDPASLVRPLARMPTDVDIAGRLSGQITRLASGALESGRADEFFEHRDNSAAAVVWKLVALDQLDLGPAESAVVLVDRLVARAEAWGGDAWADAVQDSWAAIGHARTVRERLAHRHDVTADALAPVILEHGVALVNWCFAMQCTTVVTHEIASAGSEEVLVAVRRLLEDSGTRAFRSLRAFELGLPTAVEEAPPFRQPLSDDERALEEPAATHGGTALRLAEHR